MIYDILYLLNAKNLCLVLSRAAFKKKKKKNVIFENSQAVLTFVRLQRDVCKIFFWL